MRRTQEKNEQTFIIRSTKTTLIPSLVSCVSVVTGPQRPGRRRCGNSQRRRGAAWRGPRRSGPQGPGRAAVTGPKGVSGKRSEVGVQDKGGGLHSYFFVLLTFNSYFFVLFTSNSYFFVLLTSNSCLFILLTSNSYFLSFFLPSEGFPSCSKVIPGFEKGE